MTYEAWCDWHDILATSIAKEKYCRLHNWYMNQPESIRAVYTLPPFEFPELECEYETPSSMELTVEILEDDETA